MRDFWNILVSWNWSGIIQSCSALVTVLIAYKALSSWKKQQKVAQVGLLLDQLTLSIHTFMQELTIPVHYVRFCHVRVESHKNFIKLDKSLPNPEAVYVINEFGEELSKKIFDSLKSSEKAMNEIKSLLTRLQLLDLEEIHECINACNMITWQHARIQVFAATLGSRHMNWHHPKVDKSINDMIGITDTNIEIYINDNYQLLSAYIFKVYKSLY